MAGNPRFLYREVWVRIINLKTGREINVDQLLRINFDVQLSVDSNCNDGTLEIYNFNEQFRRHCEVPPEKKEKDTFYHLYVELSAGYQDIPPKIIFAGYASGISEYKSPDWVTRLTLVDGKKEMNTSFTNRTYRKGTPVQTIINDTVKSFGCARGYVSPDITSDVVKHALTFSDSNKDIMDRYGEQYDFEWSIQKGAIQVVKSSEALPTLAIALSPSNGLLSLPQRSEVGIAFESLLVPSLQVGGIVVIEDNDTWTGACKIRTVRFTGDSEEGQFKAYVEAVIAK
jgi:hypothetical protein